MNESEVVALRRGDHCSILEGDETQEIEEESVAKDNMDLLGWLRKQLAETEPDLLHEMVKSFAEALMGAEANALCGAPFRERSEERVNRRNGYRERPFDTRAGTIALQVPKLRSGS